DGRLHGMTANAVTSVSLNPLLLLLCVDKAANAHDELANGGRFGVNILADDQEDVSRLFAETREPEEGRLGGLPFHLGPTGMPVIDGCLAYLECAVADQCAGGDHTIFIGEVLDGEVTREGEPLLFYRGGYGRIA
ncbi:MAG: flavin reductase family protein, partial [Dehalococcoidia bacterium]|nr:flavin reductase family protein [Dehalococcoidia bacterium]